jgi:ferredoxin/flavodoxin---NADP+ reductase
MLHDLIVVGSEPSGLAVAADAQRAGLSRVLVLATDTKPWAIAEASRLGLNVHFETTIERIGDGPGGSLVIESATDSYLARSCALVANVKLGGSPDYPIPPSLKERVHLDTTSFPARDTDVLVVGGGERSVTLTADLDEAGARVVLVFLSALEDLSWLTREVLLAMEHDRRVTVLWNSRPDSIEDVDGFPMAYFSDRRTPDLQFDHVVFALPEVTSEVTGPEVTTENPTALAVVGDPGALTGTVWAGEAWGKLRSACFPELTAPIELRPPEGLDLGEVDRLRLDNYNATITHFDRAHNELWVLRVEPDSRDVSHLPGQYATLGLGNWEPRVDAAEPNLSAAQARKMIRRSYSISHRIFDPRGYLIDPGKESEIEFYIVHVKPTEDKIPALTPRLAAKSVGDRIYIGPKIAGRYTLGPVDDPDMDVVFISTGTGEAPHNSMIAELLRRGHYGTILSSVTVRHPEDLAYASTYDRLMERFPNVKYLPLITRSASGPKRYIQDHITSGELAGHLAHGLDPRHTHVFLCGNPGMIGRPEWDGESPRFESANGVSELLHGLGFTLDRRGLIGNVHYEEYW